jgi:hypothetical protein
MAKYLLLKHYRGAPAPVKDIPMDQWTPDEVEAHVQFMRDFATRLEGMLVSLDRAGDDPPRAPEVRDDAGATPAPGSVVDESERTAGHQLFSEQGDVVHLPEGTRALMPTIPTFGGTGGSTSVLAAEDGEAAVRAMLDEAMAVSDHGEVTGPVIAEVEGTRVVYASFVITAGGWGFDVVTAQGLDDTYATVYVVSGAD